MDESISKALTRLIASTRSQKLDYIPFGERAYPIPMLHDIAIVTLPKPNIDYSDHQALETLLAKYPIKELHLYDTRLTRELAFLFSRLDPALDRLVIRDHHLGDKDSNTREIECIIEEVIRRYGTRADIQVKTRNEYPTCLELVNDFSPGLIQPRPDRGLKLVLTAPPDFDALQTTLAALGYTYVGQAEDVLIVEARTRTTPSSRVTSFGNAMLNAIRATASTIDAAGHMNHYTAIIAAVIRAIEYWRSEPGNPTAWSNSPHGRGLKFLGNIHSEVAARLFSSLIKNTVTQVGATQELEAHWFSYINLTGTPQQVFERYSPILEKISPIELEFLPGRKPVMIEPLDVLRAISQNIDRVRMKTSLAIGEALIKSKELGPNGLIFIEFPLRHGTIIRIGCYGIFRFPGLLKRFPFLIDVKRGIGEVPGGIGEKELRSLLNAPE